MLSSNTLLQNRYRVVRQLGKGGMGTVYEAVDQRLSSVVAIKETLVTTDEARRAFEREASLLANLRHRLLPNVTDHFAEGDGQFLVMQYIPGEDLAQLLEFRQIPFPVEQVASWAEDILKALEYLHSHNPPILHRDIKPANLKLTPEGELFLIDFGLSKGVAGQMPTLLTSRSVKGYTPAYSPLEQIHGGGTDPRSDLYSLGATLYHLLTNTPPADAPDRFNALDELRPDPLLPADQINPQVPHALAQILTQTLAMNRRNRPANAIAMRQMLHHVFASPTAAGATSPKQFSREVPPTQPGATTGSLPQTRQTEPSESDAQFISPSTPQPTIREVPNLIARPAQLPSAPASPSTPEPALAPKKGTRRGIKVLTISIAALVVAVVAVALVVAWLAKRHSNQDQAAASTALSANASPNPVKPADVSTKKSFSGEFNVGKALELVYGSYDEQKKYVKWKLTKDDLGKAQTGITPGTVFTAVNAALPFTQKEEQRYFVMTETVPARYDCHACAPLIGGATFTQRGGKWELDSAGKAILSVGSFGSAPKGKLIKIGPDKYGVMFREGSMNQGVSAEAVVVFGEVGDHVGEILEIGDYAGDNAGDCGEGSLFGTPCWKFTSKMDFEPGENPEYYDVKMTSSGTKLNDAGTVNRANQVQKYKFNNSAYVAAK